MLASLCYLLSCRTIIIPIIIQFHYLQVWIAFFLSFDIISKFNAIFVVTLNTSHHTVICSYNTKTRHNGSSKFTKFNTLRSKLSTFLLQLINYIDDYVDTFTWWSFESSKPWFTWRTRQSAITFISKQVHASHWFALLAYSIVTSTTFQFT